MRSLNERVENGTRVRGVNEVEVFEPTSILAGNYPRATQEGRVTTAGHTLPLGALVRINADGTFGLAATPAEAVGVATDFLPPGTAGTIWITGEFLGHRVTFGTFNADGTINSGTNTWRDFNNHFLNIARNIFLKESRT